MQNDVFRPGAGFAPALFQKEVIDLSNIVTYLSIQNMHHHEDMQHHQHTALLKLLEVLHQGDH